MQINNKESFATAGVPPAYYASTMPLLARFHAKDWKTANSFVGGVKIRYYQLL